MRILQINACHYQRGGAEMVYFNTSELLRRNGHEVLYFSTHGPDNDHSEFADYFVTNGDIRELSFAGKLSRSPSYLYNRKAAGNIKNLVNEFKPDIAHVHLFYAELSVSILRALKRLNVPVVHTVHDYRLLCPVNNFIDNEGKVCELCRDRHYTHCLKKRCSEGKISQSAMVMLEAYFWKYLVKPVDYIDHLIFVSKFSKEKHISFNNVFEGKSSQIYNFTNIPVTGESSEKGGYFLYFGRLSEEKGIDNLLEAFSKKPDIRLKIAGTGKLRNKVEQFARTNPNIEYCGFKKGNELEDLIRKSSFVIVPSVCFENNPMTIIESYCLGKPVIGSDIGGIPEIVYPGESGFLFKHDDPQSLASIVEKASEISEKEYKNFSDAAIKLAREKFDPQIHYTKLMELYQNLVNKNPE
jgi:glycosyltransferase involved in cell wall biosynthesis